MALDVGIIAGAMAALNFEPDVVTQVVNLLDTNSEQLDQQGRATAEVQSDWFGGAPSAHRIGLNTRMAHQAVEEEFLALATSLEKYGDAITQWGNEIRDVNDDTAAEMRLHTQAVEQVADTLQDARREAADKDMGDGTYSEPTSAPSEPSSTGSGS